MRYAALVAMFVGIALGACAASLQDHPSPDRNQPQAISICSLVGRGAPPNGTEIRVSTFYLTDYLERSRLAGPACPSFEVAFSFQSATVGAHGKNARKQLIKTMQLDEIEDRRSGVYEIDFTGRFVYRKDKQPHVMIYAEHVWSFKRMPCTAFYSAADCKVP